VLHTSAPFATSSAAPPRASLWRSLGVLLLVSGLSLLFIRAFAFEGAIGLLAQALSSDGQIGANRRTLLGIFLTEGGLLCLLLGGLAFGLSSLRSRDRLMHWIMDDPLHPAARPLLSGGTVILVTTFLGLSIIGMWWIRISTPIKFELLFAKEGPLELLTFLALIGSAAWCVLAARNTLRKKGTNLGRAIAGCYAALGVGLFVVGMEEISWGQTYLQWATPESWAAINSQQETTVHNLLAQPTLHVIEQAILIAFVLSALIGIWLGMRKVHPFITAFAPHFSTAPILILIGYSAYRFHLEVPEILFSIFIVCYAWRVYRSSKLSSIGHSDRA
jgi:hypothetical protein